MLPVTSENGFVLCARCVGQKCEEVGGRAGEAPSYLLPLAPLCTLDEWREVEERKGRGHC
jgi:hypothetical protein